MNTTQQTADRLRQLCQDGNFDTAREELYANDIISLEDGNPNTPQKVEGIEAKKEKDENFRSSLQEVHSIKVTQPIISDNYFTLGMDMDATFKETGRHNMDEICVYRTNKEGKIDMEQFFYSGE
jgi:hypothetical protein